MGAPQYEQAGADIGGTGTTNTIPVWTGASTLGDSPLTVSGSNVTGAGAIRATGTTAGAPAFTGADTDTGVYFPAANQMRFSTAGSPAISIDATQQVGIGTAGPGYKLDVSGVINTTDQVRVFSSATSADVRLNAGFGGTVAGLGTVGAHPFMLFTNNTERARIDSSGNVGIGVTPISPLHVKGNATNTDGILTLTPNTGGRNHQVQSLQASSLFRIFDQSAGASRLEIDINGNISAATTGGTFNASTTNAGIKLPATPGNTDPNTLDCYVDGGTVASGGKAWTIADNSGAGLALTITSCEYIQVGKAITICVDVSFPITVSAANSNLSLPVNAKGNWHAGTVSFQSAGAGGLAELTVMCNGAEIAFYAGTTSTRQTNANLSNKRLIFSITYFTAQ